MFPEYLFDGSEGTKMAVDDKNQVIGIPQVLDPGAATAYYYNMDLSSELGLEVPTTWAQLKSNILTAREAGYTGTVPYNNGFGWDSGGSWDAQFSLNAAYFVPMIEDNDYNGDGIVDFGEAFRKNWDEGYWYMGNNPALVEYWEEYFWKIHYGLEDGALDVDYGQPWTDGKVLYVEDGLWAIATYASDTSLNFQVGMFPAPYQSPADSEYVCDIPMTESGPYKPTISVVINIMDPAIQERPDYIADYVVDWMKMMTTNENLSIQVEEVGGVLGATKGCRVPASLTDWFSQSFPQVPQGSRMLDCSLISANETDKTALFQEYMTNMIDQDEFIARYDGLLYQSMTEYWNQDENVENAADWAETYGWKADYWTTTEPVTPPSMA